VIGQSVSRLVSKIGIMGKTKLRNKDLLIALARLQNYAPERMKQSFNKRNCEVVRGEGFQSKKMYLMIPARTSTISTARSRWAQPTPNIQL
jgi:hypothetical protein